MNGKDNKNKILIANELNIIKYLKNNRDFFKKYPKILDILEFPHQNEIEGKVVNLMAYQSNRLKNDNTLLKNKFSKIINTGKINEISQKKMLKACEKIIKTGSLNNFFKVIKNDCPTLLNCEEIKIFSSIKNNNFFDIDYISERVINSLFQNNKKINLENKVGLLKIFFKDSKKIIKSFLILKINQQKKHSYILVFGSLDKNEFTSKNSTELISFFQKICEIKLDTY